MRMGRRARTNCSPIDSAMEKYHNDIGSRLSGVFVPPQPSMDNSSNPTTEALSMLTLDTRSKSHINHGNQQDTLLNATSATNSSHPHNTTDSSSSITCHCPTTSTHKTEKSQTLPMSLAQSPAMSACQQKTQESSHSSCGAEDNKEKRRLVDKITRALFQRKHTCSRCQRKSRSCLPNKTFNSSEKHYTCGSCRETSHAMKSLLSGQNVNNNNNNNSNDANSDKDSNNLPVPFIGIRIASRDDVILPKPRTHLKDSGYETVTSCSTVASSHSHNSAVTTTNGSTKNQIQTDVNNTSRLEDFTTNQRYNNTNCSNNGGTPYYCEHSPSVQHHGHDARVNPTTGLEQFMGVVTSDNTNVRVLKQVKTRYVENYDGYLPNAQVNQDTCVVKRPALPVFADNTIASPSSEGVDPAWNRSNTYATPIDNTNNMCTYGSTGQECQGVHYTETKNTKQAVKVCYTCGSSTKPCFHLPWEGGWLCEDCLDGVF